METTELDIKVFRLDDIPLIYNIIHQANMISIIDKHLPVHGLHDFKKIVLSAFEKQHYQRSFLSRIPFQNYESKYV